MPTIIDSLLVSLGFQVNPEGLEKFAKHTQDVKQMVGAVFGFTVVKQIGAFVERTVEAAANIHDLADAYDVTSTKMAAMEEVAIANSVSLEQMASAYRGVSQMAGQAAMGVGRGAKLFEQFGLQAKDGAGKAKTGMEVLGDVAEKMSKLGTTERLAMAGRLGIDPLLARQMARMGRDQFMAQVAEAERSGILSERDYVVADETAVAFQQLHHTVRQFSALVAVQLGPVVQDLNKAFREWVGQNRELIKQKTREVFDRVREVLSKVIDVARELAKHTTLLKIAFGAIIAQKIGAAFGGWIKPMVGLVGAMKKANTVAEGLKVGLSGLKSVATGGLIAAIGLLAEDLWTFYQGGESVTGWLLERFPYAVEAAEAALAVLGGAFAALVAGSGPVGMFAFAIGGIVLAVKDVFHAWNPLMQWFGEQWDRLADKVRLFAKLAAWPVWVVAKLTGQVDDVFGKDKGTNVPKTPEEYQAEAAEQEAAAYKGRPRPGMGVLDVDRGNMLTWGRGLAAAAAGAGVSMTNITQHVGPTTIQVNGAKDPRQVAAEVMREQERRRQLNRLQTRDAQPAHR